MIIKLEHTNNFFIQLSFKSANIFIRILPKNGGCFMDVLALLGMVLPLVEDPDEEE